MTVSIGSLQGGSPAVAVESDTLRWVDLCWIGDRIIAFVCLVGVVQTTNMVVLHTNV